VEYTGAVGTAPSLNSRKMNGPFDATSPSSARVFLRMGAAAVTDAMAMELTALRRHAAYLGNSFYS
jgi:hypothetical protein